jgi:hypothetical protein
MTVETFVSPSKSLRPALGGGESRNIGIDIPHPRDCQGGYRHSPNVGEGEPVQSLERLAASSHTLGTLAIAVP